MVDNGSEDLVLVVEAEPVRAAEQVLRRVVKVLGVVGEGLLVDADPAWADPICTVLAHKDVTVKRLGRARREDLYRLAPLLRWQIEPTLLAYQGSKGTRREE